MKTNGKIQLFPFARIAVMLIAGMLVQNYLCPTLPAFAWAGAMAAAIVASIVLMRRPVSSSVCVLVSTFLLGAFCMCINGFPRLPQYSSDYVAFEAVVTSQPQRHGKVIQQDLLITKINDATLEKPLKTKSSILRDTITNNYRQIKIGMGLQAYAKLEEPYNFIPNSKFDYRQWLINHGYLATTFIYYDNWQLAQISLRSLSKLQRARLRTLVLRERLTNVIAANNAHADTNATALLQAMTLGDKSLISKQMRDAYSTSGAAHILALSGLHIGIIYSLLIFLLPVRRFRALSFGIVLVGIWCYVFLVGLPPSAVRAATMISIYCMASVANRSQRSLGALSFAAVVMLIANPLLLYDLGFQMSFLSVLSILIFMKPIYKIMPERLRNFKIVRFLWGMVSISLAAQIGVAPLVMHTFGNFPVYFLATNIVVVPLATIIVYSTLLLFLASPIKPLQAAIAWFLFSAAKVMNGWVSTINSLPLAYINNINISSLQTILIYLLIIVLTLLIYKIANARYRY